MAHRQQNEFVNSVLSKFKSTLQGQCYDFGSLNINGSMRKDIEALGMDYKGIDIGEGENVDIVSLAHEFTPNSPADLVVSCEMLEHDRFWKQSLQNMYDVLKPGGLIILSCATYGRPEHGTARTSPQNSPFTAVEDEWANYYKNLGEAEFREVYKDEMFTEYQYKSRKRPNDLYFYGIKS